MIGLSAGVASQSRNLSRHSLSPTEIPLLVSALSDCKCVLLRLSNFETSLLQDKSDFRFLLLISQFALHDGEIGYSGIEIHGGSRYRQRPLLGPL